MNGFVAAELLLCEATYVPTYGYFTVG